jgi:hypothetical protein
MKPKLKLPTPPALNDKTENTPKSDDPQFEVEHLVNLIAVYTNCTRLEARHLISSVVGRPQEHPLSEILEWCVYVKEIERAQKLISDVAKGQAMVSKNVEGKWVSIVQEKSVPTPENSTKATV